MLCYHFVAQQVSSAKERVVGGEWCDGESSIVVSPLLREHVIKRLSRGVWSSLLLLEWGGENSGLYSFIGEVQGISLSLLWFRRI